MAKAQILKSWQESDDLVYAAIRTPDTLAPASKPASVEHIVSTPLYVVVTDKDGRVVSRTRKTDAKLKAELEIAAKAWLKERNTPATAPVPLPGVFGELNL